MLGNGRFKSCLNAIENIECTVKLVKVRIGWFSIWFSYSTLVVGRALEELLPGLHTSLVIVYVNLVCNNLVVDIAPGSKSPID